MGLYFLIGKYTLYAYCVDTTVISSPLCTPHHYEKLCVV